MTLLIIKYLTTAGIVVLVSEVAKRSDKIGALIAALPLVTLLVLLWLYLEGQSQDKLANHAWYTFWYVLPTLPMFAMFPYLLPRLGFGLTMLASMVISVTCFLVLALLVRKFGIDLL